jgi:hypothetical protein
VNRLDQFAETNAAKIRHAAEPCHELRHRDPLGEIGSRRMRRGMAMSRIDAFSSVIVRHLGAAILLRDVSEDVANELRRRCDLEMQELPPNIQEFVERFEDRRQLKLRLG